MNNNCSGNSAAGIYALDTDNRIDGNHAAGNTWGIRADGDYNLIVRNDASYSVGADFAIVTNNINAATIDPGSNFTNANPWANFQF